MRLYQAIRWHCIVGRDALQVPQDTHGCENLKPNIASICLNILRTQDSLNASDIFCVDLLIVLATAKLLSLYNLPLDITEWPASRYGLLSQMLTSDPTRINLK
jgi:hypothetical protein